ncbi:MAG: 2-isopropylmalate synthase [Gemmataceae bacterium]|nr:2-isopropylmalate synthase [Gemmataceae bacterium]
MANPSDRVLIFDTTLRDGEQSPGASMNLAEKLEIAHALRALGVDIIEAGFPIASPGDFEAVQAIAREVNGPTICGLARCAAADIDRAAEAVKDAAQPRIHTFISTSDIHITHQLRSDRKSVLAKARECVARARAQISDIEFSPMDATRSELDFLYEVLEAVIAEGATTLNIPDTVGYATPAEYGALIAGIRKNVRGADKVVISTHTHDDLGLAVANALAGVEGGARQVECTINGIGERAGNAALEEVVMALRTRSDVYKGLHTAINTKLLVPSSRKLALVTGLAVPRNKAIVGQNAFAHESGIHQDGVLKHRNTYEIMVPADVGLTDTELVLGKHSGRHALRQRVEALGYHFDDTQFQLLFEQFKALADRKKTVYDADVEALAEAMLHKGSTSAMWTLEAFTTNAGTGTIPMAAVCLWRNDGEIFKDAAMGDGPIDAIFKCIERIAGIEVKLRDYRVRSVTDGEDAQGEAQLECEYQGQTLRGRGVSTDIVEASAQAFLQVINRAAQKLGPARLNPYDVQPVAAAQEAAGS